MKRILIWFLTIIIMFTASGCTGPSSEESIKTTGMYFDTVISIEVWGSTDTSILAHCKDLCAEYEQLLSRPLIPVISPESILQMEHLWKWMPEQQR